MTGQREEQVRRNEERREVREVEADERVLHGNRDVERDDERIVVGGLRRRDRDELPQQEEADEREEDEKRCLAEREGDREDDDEPPGHAHAGIDRKQAGAMFGIAAAVQGPVGVEGAGGGKKREADEKDAVGLLNGESESHGCAREMMALRARSRKSSFRSSGECSSGAPKRMEQTVGTGSSTPLGMARCRFSM